MLLHKFEGDFSRERFLDMDDWEVNNVLARPDFHRGDVSRGYWPVPRMADQNDPPVGFIGPKRVFYHPDRIKARRTLGMTDAEIEAEWLELAARKGYAPEGP